MSDLLVQLIDALAALEAQNYLRAQANGDAAGDQERVERVALQSDQRAA